MFEIPHNIGLLQQPARYHCLQTGQEQHHSCTRFCQFEHVVGNVYTCTSSGKTHVCDSTCAERIQLDAYSSVCRLSRRVFVNKAPCTGPSRCAAPACIRQTLAYKSSNELRHMGVSDYLLGPTCSHRHSGCCACFATFEKCMALMSIKSGCEVLGKSSMTGLSLAVSL